MFQRIFSISNRSGVLFFAYDENSRINHVVDHTGRYVSYDYDDNGNLREFTNADENTLEYQYEDHRLTQITDFNGNIFLTNVYDNEGRVTKQYMLDQGEFLFGYDDENRVTTLTDGEGNMRQYSFDAIGQMTSVEDDESMLEKKQYCEKPCPAGFF
jgi:YD repeat-containing protein